MKRLLPVPSPRALLFTLFPLFLVVLLFFMQVKASSADSPSADDSVPKFSASDLALPDEPAQPSPETALACQIKESDRQPAWRLPYMTNQACEDGFAGNFPCNNVDLAALMPLNMIGGGNGNDIWGWTDPLTGREYALMGRTNGTSFVDISDPFNPVYLGNLPSHTFTSTWRDIKVYQNHAYIVADLNGSHGVQVLDLTQLRNVANPPVTFAETAHYGNIGSAHNIAINEETGYAYVVGGSSGATRVTVGCT